MRLWWALAALALAAVPGASACVTPILDFQFEGKPDCRAGVPEADRQCAVLGPDAPLEYAGELVWTWDTRGCGVEQMGLPADQTIILRGVGTNPDWVNLTIDPAKVVITQEEQLAAENLHVDPDGFLQGTVRVPVTVAFEANGTPQGEALQELREAEGIAIVMVQAKAEATDMFTASFGSETFRFDASAYLAEAGPRDSPGAAVPLLAGLLGAVAARRRLRA